MLCQTINTRDNKRPMLEIEDLEILAYWLNEPKEKVEAAINNNIFRIEKEQNKKYLCSDYVDDFYRKLKEISDKQKARRLGGKKQQAKEDLIIGNENKPTIEEMRKYCVVSGYGKEAISKDDYIYLASCSEWKNELDKMIKCRPQIKTN